MIDSLKQIDILTARNTKEIYWSTIISGYPEKISGTLDKKSQTLARFFVFFYNNGMRVFS